MSTAADKTRGAQQKLGSKVDKWMQERQARTERAMQLIWKQRARRPAVCWSGAWCNQGNKANRADTDRFGCRAVTSAGELLD